MDFYHSYFGFLINISSNNSVWCSYTWVYMKLRGLQVQTDKLVEGRSCHYPKHTKNGDKLWEQKKLEHKRSNNFLRVCKLTTFWVLKHSPLVNLVNSDKLHCKIIMGKIKLDWECIHNKMLMTTSLDLITTVRHDEYTCRIRYSWCWKLKASICTGLCNMWLLMMVYSNCNSWERERERARRIAADTSDDTSITFYTNRIQFYTYICDALREVR